MKYIYGPVASWRLGISLGIDLVGPEKSCGFDCTYCQLGTAEPVVQKRKVYAPTSEIIKEFDSLPKNLYFDYVTFSGMGEPTLAGNLNEVALALKKRQKKPIALLTNSALLSDPQVRRELKPVDLVIAKLDAATPKTFQRINRPEKGLNYQMIIDGIFAFKREYPQKLALQIMFCDENKAEADQIAGLAKKIDPVKVFIGTPIRPALGTGAVVKRPLPENEIYAIERLFAPLKTMTVYSTAFKKEIEPLDREDALKRRPRAGDEI